MYVINVFYFKPNHPFSMLCTPHAHTKVCVYCGDVKSIEIMRVAVGVSMCGGDEKKN